MKDKSSHSQAAKTRKILLVDDDPDFRDLMEHRLKALGHIPELTSTAEEFKEAIEAEPPHLCLVDLKLGSEKEDLNGFDLIHFIRRHLQLSLPIVVVSVRQDSLSIAHAIELGANDYIQKPAHKDRFNETISPYLRSDHPERGGGLYAFQEEDLTPVPEDDAQKTLLSFDMDVKRVHESGLTLSSSYLISKESVFFLKNGLLQQLFPYYEGVWVSVLSNSIDRENPTRYELEVEFENNEEHLAEQVRTWIFNQTR